MAGIKELIQKEANNTLSFGDYELQEKAKRSDFEFSGDLYKVKTYCEITKLEKNGMFLYESVPGTAVHEFLETEDGVSFQVECKEDTQIILGMEDGAEYQISIDGKDMGAMKTNMGGKLVLSIEAGESRITEIKAVKL